MASPTDDELRAEIRGLLPSVNIDMMGIKAFVKRLSQKMQVDLKPRKDFIKVALAEAINEADAEDEEDPVVTDDEDEPKKGGLAQRKEISDKLAAFLGKGKIMARTDVVKELWNYIRENNLQNPSDKREIFLDEAMQEVFECETFSMFTMNKYVSAHIAPFPAVDLTSKPTKRKATRSAKAPKKKRKVGSQPPYRLSEELSEIVGTDILPRPQVVSKIWVYIREHELQNPNDKREILCDEKLQKVMKKTKISMFKMNAMIGAHMLEKLDRSAYKHDEEDDVDDGDEEE